MVLLRPAPKGLQNRLGRGIKRERRKALQRLPARASKLEACSSQRVPLLDGYLSCRDRGGRGRGGARQLVPGPALNDLNGGRLSAGQFRREIGVELLDHGQHLLLGELADKRSGFALCGPI